MKTIEEVFKEADFSKETDLKEKLKKRLFGISCEDGKELSDDELEDVAAAGVPGRPNDSKDLKL
ncbi:MAG: hypothetical protein K6B75_06335 [Lachnospiraceae bacterium]|nr:hypothetical protein [Lachnospiraceae bacterium]